MRWVSAVTFPMRAGFAVAGTALEIAELAVTTTRVALTAGASGSLNAAALANPRGPLQLLAQLSELAGEDRALGHAFKAGGPLDRLLEPGGPVDRLTAPGGTLDRLLDSDGPLDRVLAQGGVLDRLLEDDGPLDRLLAEGGLLDRLTAPDGPIERLTAPDGPVEQLTRTGGLVERLTAEDGPVDLLTRKGGLLEILIEDGGAIERLVARGGPLDQLALLADLLTSLKPSVELLQDTVDTLSASVVPLGELVGRLPTRWVRGRPVQPYLRR